MFDAIISAAVFGPLLLLPLVPVLIWMNRDRRAAGLLAGLLLVLVGLGLLSDFASDLGLPMPYNQAELPGWRRALAAISAYKVLWIALLALVLPWFAIGPSRSPASRVLGWALIGLSALILAATLVTSGLRFT